MLAGIAGVLSLTSAKSGALVGVFIAATTVPAAADSALSLALQRKVWRRLPRTTPRLPEPGRRGTIDG